MINVSLPQFKTKTFTFYVSKTKNIWENIECQYSFVKGKSITYNEFIRTELSKYFQCQSESDFLIDFKYSNNKVQI